MSICLASPADAEFIIHVGDIAGSGPVAVATFTFPEFDPVLGTLDRVEVSLAGNLEMQAILAPLQTITPQILFDAEGAGARGFDFALAGARFILPTASNPSASTPLPVTLATSFALDFQITAASDLTGVVIASTSNTVGTLIPPTNVEARRDDFVEGIAPLGVSEVFGFLPSGFDATNIRALASVLVTYVYTPEEASVTVPLPATLALFAPTALLLRARRR